MVDLGFLLITFFMFATTLAQPKVAKFRMPNDNFVNMPMPKETTLIILADSLNNYYSYNANEELQTMKKYKNITSIRKNIIKKKSELQNLKISIILKIHPNAKYQNLIEMLDEILINEIDFYVVDKINNNEQELINKL